MTLPAPAATSRAHADPDARLHPASGQPGTVEHHPGTDDVGWDLGYWCRLAFGWDFEERQVLAHLTLRNDNGAWAVTSAQLRDFAARLIGLADRADTRAARTTRGAGRDR